MRHAIPHCPHDVRLQIDAFVAGVRKILGPNLAGIYLHGSLAMGCFNRATSDIDLLVVTRQAIRVSSKLRLVRMLLEMSRRPSPIEVTFLSARNLRPWRYPARFDLHFSEDWRRRFEANPARAIADQRQMKDPDLAVHIGVARARGIGLIGAPIKTAFPAVPRDDYLNSVLRDFSWSRRRIARIPVYFVLNVCRIHVFAACGEICSKEEGAARVVETIPPRHANLVRRALIEYRGGDGPARFDKQELRSFATYMEREIDRRLKSRGG